MMKRNRAGNSGPSMRKEADFSLDSYKVTIRGNAESGQRRRVYCQLGSFAPRGHSGGLSASWPGRLHILMAESGISATCFGTFSCWIQEVLRTPWLLGALEVMD